jgi:hypothetical protein
MHGIQSLGTAIVTGLRRLPMLSISTSSEISHLELPGTHRARNVVCRYRWSKVSAKCPEDTSKLCSFWEEPYLAAQASTLIVVPRQWIRCPAGELQCPGYGARETFNTDRCTHM